MTINYLNSTIELDTTDYYNLRISRYDLNKFPELNEYIPSSAFINNDFATISDLNPSHREIVYNIIKNNQTTHIVERKEELIETKYILNKHNSFFKYGNATLIDFITTQIVNFINTPYQTLPFLTDYGSRIKEKLQTKNININSQFVSSEIQEFISKLSLIYNNELWIDLKVDNIIFIENYNYIDTEIYLKVILTLINNDNDFTTFEVAV